MVVQKAVLMGKQRANKTVDTSVGVMVALMDASMANK